MSRARFRDTVLGQAVGVSTLSLLPAATVNVYQPGTSTPIVDTIFAADTGAAVLVNPLTVDASGVLEFWLERPQRVDLVVSKAGYTSQRVTVDVAIVAAERGVFNVLEYEAKLDGVTDDAVAIQRALDAAEAGGGGTVVVPVPTGVRALFGTTLQIPDNVHLMGLSTTAAILRYTGAGVAIQPKGAGVIRANFSHFLLQLVQAGAVGFDAARFISTTWRSVRIAWAGGGAASATGIRAIITNVAWTSYFNVVDDCTFDGLGLGIDTDASVAQQANRWRLLAPTFLSCADGIRMRGVAGWDIIGAYFNEITGTGIILANNTAALICDRNTIVAARMESNVGGVLFNIAATANRTAIIGFAVHAGTQGITQLGTNPLVVTAESTGVTRQRYCIGPFTRSDLAAGLAGALLWVPTVDNLATVGTISDGIVMPFAGRVSGITATGGNARTAGSAIFAVRKNASAGTLFCALDAATPQFARATQTSGDTFAAGDRLGVTVTTDAGWAPTPDVMVYLWIDESS